MFGAVLLLGGGALWLLGVISGDVAAWICIPGALLVMGSDPDGEPKPWADSIDA